MRRIAAALFIPAALLLAACGSSATTSSSTTSAATEPNATDPLGPGAAVPAGLSCSDIGGVFMPHGADGRGDCEPADPRPHCHVAPDAQDDHYVATFTLMPPFSNGTVTADEVNAFLAGASNADCWKAPAQ